MSSILKTFNNQIYNLFVTLTKRFPNNRELKIALTGIETLKFANQRIIMEIFLVHGYKFKEKIVNKDNTFFLKYDHSKEEYCVSNLSSSLNIIKNLKNCWKDLETDEQENIWKYLQVLVTLADKYVNSKSKTH